MERFRSPILNPENLDLNNSQNSKWWSEEGNFFGRFYMIGDNSKEGYLESVKSLEERTLAEVEGIEDLLELPAQSKILDVPCGYGRHSVELAMRGYGVTGFDLNSTHLETARDRAQAKGARVDWQQGDMLKLESVAEYDAVINMFYSFGFFDSDEDNQQVAANFYNALKPGGRFLMHTDVNLPRVLRGMYPSHEIRNLVGGGTLEVVDRYNPETKRMDGRWIIKDTNTPAVTRDYSVRIYSKEEFTELCYRVGFSNCEVYSDWTGNSYSENSEDMIVVAKK